MLDEEVEAARRDGRVSSSGCGCRRHVALPFRMTLIISSFRSTSESSNNELSYSSPVLVLILVPLLQEGPARCWDVSCSCHIDKELPLEAPAARSRFVDGPWPWKISDMSGFAVALMVFPRLGRVAVSEICLWLMNESTDIDFLRVDGGARESGEDGEERSGLSDTGVIFSSEEMDESAVMKVS